jgi:hypothetical protein
MSKLAHLLEDLAALVSLVFMPYVLIAVGLGIAALWVLLKRRLHHRH